MLNIRNRIKKVIPCDIMIIGLLRRLVVKKPIKRKNTMMIIRDVMLTTGSISSYLYVGSFLSVRMTNWMDIDNRVHTNLSLRETKQSVKEKTSDIFPARFETNYGNNQYWINFIITCALLVLGLYAQAQEPLSLNTILKLVEQNNQELKAFDSQQESQQAKATGSNSWMAPMVGAGTFMTPYPGQNTMDKGSLMFTLEQGLPNKSMNRAKEKYLSSLSSITAAQKSVAFNDLRTLAKQNYYTVIVNQKRLKYFEESLIIMNNMKKLGEIRYQYNKGSLSQIYKAEGRIYEMQNMVEEIRNDMAVAKINLNILMNRNPDTDFSISSDTSIYFKPIAVVDSAYLANNISELKMAESEISSMRLDADMIRKEANPEIKLKFDHMSPLSSMMPQQYSAMAMLSIPLAPWSAKSYKANLKANQLEIEAMEHRKSSMINNMYGMVKTMERNIITMEKRIRNFEHKIIPAMQKNLDVLMLNYQENKEELPMVIDGWETLNKSQLDYTNELENYYKMIVDYEKSIEK